MFTSRIRVRRAAAVRWGSFRVLCPLTPGPSPPAGARGGFRFQFSVETGCFPSWLRVGHDIAELLRSCSTLNFLASTLYGREAIAPSPPTPLPLRGRGEDFVFSVVLHWRALGRGECSKRRDGGVNDRVQDFGGCRTDPSQDGCSLSSLLDSLHDARFLIGDLLNSCCGVP